MSGVPNIQGPYFVPGWKWLAPGASERCTSCARLTEIEWKYFSTPSTWTLALCADCVKKETA